MKIFFAFLLVTSFSSAHAKDISLQGLKAKALMDTLTANEKLQVFTDAAMGKRYLSMKDISCLKNTFPGKEIIACTFHGETNNVSLYSDTDKGMEGIRYVLVEAAKNETQTTDTLKELVIKKLDCKVAGIGHVLDDNDVELKYSCTLSI